MTDVSVIVPTYRRPTLLAEALASVRAQTHASFECLVIDDGSGDETTAVTEKLAASDARFRLISVAHSALPGRVRNAGLAAARTPLVAFLDDDDLFLPHKLERELRAFASDPELSLVCARVEEFGARSGTWPTVVLPPLLDFERLCAGNLIATSTVMARVETLRALGGFDETLPRAQDYDLWLRVARSGARIRALDETLARYRVHDANISADRLRSLECLELVFRRLAERGEISRDRLARTLRANYAERARLAPTRFERLLFRARALLAAPARARS